MLSRASRNALELLETIVKNCGDIVHMHVAEKGVLHQMVRIIRRKPDLHVKEKILILIDTWQEAFGGPRARHQQYYGAYQELLHAGAVFPHRSESSAPVFTPPQTQPLSSYPQNLRNTDFRPEAAESSTEAEFPTLSLTEIQNARGISDVLAEMLNALNPGNKEGLGQDVLADLVEQCRTYKQRVVHLVNSTTDESLLCQGLALNDDLQRVLAKHEAIASGTPVKIEKPNPEPTAALLDVEAPLVDTGDGSKKPDGGSTSSSGAGVNPLNQLLLPAPPGTTGLNPPAAANPKVDLLSGDDFASPKVENSLALVPLGEKQPTAPASQHNALVLFDMFSDGNNTPNSNNIQPANLGTQTNPLNTPFQQQQNFQSPETGFYQNGNGPNIGSPQYGHSFHVQGTGPSWNGQFVQQQQPASPVSPPSPAYGAQTGGSLPPPPWEVQPDNNLVAGSQLPQPLQVTQVVVTHAQPVSSGMHPWSPQSMGNEQVVGMYTQPIAGGQLSAINHQAGQSNQFVGFHPQQVQGGQYMGMVPQPMQSGQMASMYPQQQMYGNQMPGYGYGQQQGVQYLQQQMYGMSVRNDNGMTNSSYQVPTSSYLPPMKKTSKPEDKLFGDLVDIAKLKSKPLV
ncbi:TOM1-like protein 9 isoform X2 [Tripterygium wilfordii]|uniref:TOM1-like protein 9 isoform X2 n=1 Tax=Tripterygium wilfordii TaxID=458696 RepID=UPI0018F852B5|nr:TOM1-like protein 9 isoform X2 [Tripterygium wilfordii]